MNKRFLSILVFFLTLLPRLVDAQQVSIPDVVKQTNESVVSIQIHRSYAYRESGLGFFGRFLMDFFEIKRDKKTKLRFQSEGSGVVLDTTGLILTNAHVVSRADAIKVSLHNGKSFPAYLVGIDHAKDLALLKADINEMLHPIVFGDSDEIEPGSAILAIGNPYGYRHTVTQGIVSARDRNVNSSLKDLIQLDAAVNPGNSGGPIVNLKGEMIGLVTITHAWARGISFAIPSKVVQNLLPELKQGIKRNQDLEEFYFRFSFSIRDSKSSEGMEQILIGNVKPGSEVYKTGLRPGDILSRFRKMRITRTEDLLKEALKVEKGGRIYLEIQRDGRNFFTWLEAK